MKYSVLTYNLNNYEILHEVEEEAYEQMKDNVEFVYVTDDRTITSNTWNVKYVDDLKGDVFDRCYQIRFNPFKYVSNDVVVRIDGSVGISKSLNPLVEEFEKGGYDICLMPHPERMDLVSEYSAWVNGRGYNVNNALKILHFLGNFEGYPIQENFGLFQYNIMIQRNNDMNNTLNGLTYNFSKLLAGEGETIHRVDQCIGSAIVNKYFAFHFDKMMFISQKLCDGRYFKWYYHNTNKPIDVHKYNYCKPLFCGKEIENVIE